MFNETHLYRAEEALAKAKSVLLGLSVCLALVELGYAAGVANERTANRDSERNKAPSQEASE